MIARLLLQNLMWTAGLGALLFLPAGTLHWPAAWLYLATTAVLGLAGGLWLAKVDPALLEERMRPMMQKGQPAADKRFMLVFGCVALIWFIVIGLDHRRHLSEMPMALQALGYVLLLAATAFILRVVRENSFAAPVVKVQAERGASSTPGPTPLCAIPCTAARCCISPPWRSCSAHVGACVVAGLFRAVFDPRRHRGARARRRPSRLC